MYLFFAIQYFLRVRHQTLSGALHGVWHSYRTKSPSTRIGIALISTLLLLSFVGITSVFAMIDRENAIIAATIKPTPAPTLVLGTTPTPTANSQSIVTPTAKPTQPTPIPTQKPTPTPTSKPAIVPTSPPPRPTQPPVKPTPTQPACQAVNNNPWCYNFNPGKLIYYPPSGFCNYFNCIPSFYGADDPGDGYIVECSDGAYSQSGGESGACSYHGGVMRPLYSH